MTWLDRREPWDAQQEDARDEGDIDYARVIHSASFRRLQGKTQILNLGDSDFYRTRLTHSLEVAQIGSGLVKQLAKSFPKHDAAKYLPDRSTIQAIGCSHDLGHPPFGHGGEIALNYCMRNADREKVGGFEGNGQTLRILSRLENFSADAGANLSRRTLLGILKYPVSFSEAENTKLQPRLQESPSTLKIIDDRASTPPKCYLNTENDVVAWILKPLSGSDRDHFQSIEKEDGKHNASMHKSLDCSIMDVADDIAYGVHDFEDAVALKLVSAKQFQEFIPEDKCSSFLNALKEKYPGESENDVYGRMLDGLFGATNTRKRYISRLVHHFITAIEYDEYSQFDEPLLKFRAKLASPQAQFLKALKKLVFSEVIKNPSVQHLEFKGQSMVVSVFEALQSDPKRLLPTDTFKKYEAEGDGLRVICDFVAGMTDAYLLKTYERLFAPRLGSVFDKL